MQITILVESLKDFLFTQLYVFIGLVETYLNNNWDKYLKLLKQI